MSVKINKLVDIIYIDFRKAFDLLVHSKILVKRSSYGIGYELLYWIQSVLTKRTNRVIVDNTLSKHINVSSGVVQGSVLGPLIFIRFINDIVDCLTTARSNITSCCIFANDLKLYFSYESLYVYSSQSITLHDTEN